jgi:hypothetical protein
MKQRIRSEKAKDRWVRSVQTRREEMRALVASKGFPDANVHECEAIESYANKR